MDRIFCLIIIVKVTVNSTYIYQAQLISQNNSKSVSKTTKYDNGFVCDKVKGLLK